MTDVIDALRQSLAGRYTIERELGAGGMATVYLARDIRHERFVAIKVLRAELGAVLGVERFLSEIKVTANLQHPNLLPLFDSGEAGGQLFYVMPFVEGESIGARLKRETVLPVDEAIHIAVSCANALDYAHRKNVVHRDLKPENVMLVDGQPLIADFGIALAVSNAGGARLTQTGISIGTPQYMSPEQAMGERLVDGRSDIFSLATMLYEMLTGEPAVTGPTASALLARLVIDTPRPIRETRSAVPEYVVAAIERAMAKLPADRWATAREFAAALTTPRASTTAPTLLVDDATARATRDSARSATPGAQTEVAWGAPTTPRRVPESASSASAAGRVRRALPWALAVASLLAAAWGWYRPQSEVGPRARFALDLGESAGLRTDRIGMNVAVSNDGMRLAWLGGDPTPRIFVRSLDDPTPIPVPGTENAMNPQFSPSGDAIAFLVAGRLQRTALAGGPVALIADEVVNYSWGDNDVVVFSRVPGANAGLWSVGASGGTAVRLTTPDTAKKEVRHVWPNLLPGGKAALFALRFTGSASEDDSLAVITLRDHAVTRLGIRGSNPRFAPTGHLLFSNPDGSVRGIRFDPGSFRVTGPQVPVLGNVAVLPAANVGQGGAMTIAYARNGVMVYQPGSPTGQLVRVSRTGAATLVQPDTQRFDEPRVSPDGKRVMTTIAQSNGSFDLWMHAFGGTSTRFTSDGRSDRASWSPDGRRIAWRSRGSGTKWAAPDGSGASEQVFMGGAGLAWSPSGNFGFTVTTGSATGANVMRVSFDQVPVTPTPFVATPATETAPRVSPDGGWLAFVSNQSGRAEVYVTSTRDPSNLRQVSTHGADEPVWAPSGRELFYRDGRKLIAAQVETKSGFVILRRDTVFADIYRMGNNSAAYDVMPDGQAFIFVKPIGAGAPPMIVFRWFDELRQRMAQAK